MDSRIARQWVASAAETATSDSPKIWSWRSPIFLDLEPAFLAIRQGHLLSPFSTQAGAIWEARSGTGIRVFKMGSRIARQWVASAAETVTSDSPKIMYTDWHARHFWNQNLQRENLQNIPLLC
jgi:hypothetical protein